ncbi:MAG: hypothetical protein GXO89_02685, partial [Chlorobi bacterium]|nr:hypothetical protein [Chlorobiota bacterium]
MNLTRQIFSSLKAYCPYCVLAALFILFFSFLGIGQIKLSDLNNIEHYTEENGLASTYITDVQEDKHGFLWIATSKGITRYDGTHFTNFTTIPKDSIKHEIGFVNSFAIGLSGENLWFGCDEGLFFSSIDAVNFQKVEQFIPSVNYSFERTTDLLLDGQKTVWVSNLGDGLSRIDLIGKKHELFSFENKSRKDKFLINNLTCMVKDPKDNSIFWIGTLAGLIRFNSKSKEYQVYVYENNQEMAQNKIRRIHVSNEEVFLGTWGKGIVIFDKHSKQFSQPLIEQYPNSHLLIIDIYGSNESNTWITSGDGLIQYDPLLKRVKTVINHDRPKGLLKGVSFIDSRGLIWFCDEKGLFKYDPLRSQNTFIELEKRNNVQIPMQVREIILEQDFFYVLGHASSGLHKVSLKDYSFETVQIPAFKYPNIYSNLRDMVVMDNGNFLIVFGNKILFFNPRTQ